MAWVSAEAARVSLARALAAAAAIAGGAGCSFGADPAGRFACDSLTPCPDGIECIGGYCQANGAVDASIAGRDDAGRPDAGDQGVPLQWKQVAVGERDGAIDLVSVSTEEPLSGGAGAALYLAFVSTKPPRPIASVGGLGAEWMEIRQQCSGRSTASLALFWAMGGDSLGGIVTATLQGDATQGSALISVHRYAGASPNDPIGNVSSANSNGNDAAAGCDGGIDTAVYAWSAIDTGAPGSFVVSGAHTANYQNHTPGDAFVERSDDQSSGSSIAAGVAVQDRRVPDPSTNVHVTGGWGDDRPDWAVVAVELHD